MRNRALLLVDVQKGLDEPVWGKRNNPQAEKNIALLLAAWRELELPIIHIRHCSVNPESPLRPELPGNAFKEEARPRPDEIIFSKTVNSAFIGTELEQYLHENGISALAIVGLTTDHCVSTTTRMAGNLGFDTILVSDATATFERVGFDGAHFSAEEMHNINLASLNGEFCEVQTTADMLVRVAS